MTVTLAPKPAAGAAPAATGPRSCQLGSPKTSPNPSLTDVIRDQNLGNNLGQMRRVLDPKMNLGRMWKGGRIELFISDLDDTLFNLDNKNGRFNPQIYDRKLEKIVPVNPDYYCYVFDPQFADAAGNFDWGRFLVRYIPHEVPLGSRDHLMNPTAADRVRKSFKAGTEAVLLTSRHRLPIELNRSFFHAAYAMRDPQLKKFLGGWAQELCVQKQGTGCEKSQFPIGAEKGLSVLAFVEGALALHGLSIQSLQKENAQSPEIEIGVQDDGNANILGIAFLVGALLPRLSLTIDDYERVDGEVFTQKRQAIQVKNGRLYGFNRAGKPVEKAFFDPKNRIWKRTDTGESLDLSKTNNPRLEVYLGLKLDCPISSSAVK